jgi:Coenzyme PQQ synthesis protein D (PqqD).
MEHPRQADGLEINEAANGYVIFDSGRDRIHYLNHTAVLILELCNGELSAEEIAAFLQEAYSLPDAPMAEVQAYVLRLTEEGLVA